MTSSRAAGKLFTRRWRWKLETLRLENYFFTFCAINKSINVPRSHNFRVAKRKQRRWKAANPRRQSYRLVFLSRMRRRKSSNFKKPPNTIARFVVDAQSTRTTFTNLGCAPGLPQINEFASNSQLANFSPPSSQRSVTVFFTNRKLRRRAIIP